MSRLTWMGSSKPPLSTMPAICGKFADTWAVSTPSTTSGRSPGVTTTAPSKRRSSTCGSVIAATTIPVVSWDSSDSSPLTRVPPQAAILAVGEVREVPVVRDAQLVPGVRMTIALTCDHRILYGAPAAEFLARVRQLLEQPLYLLV